MNINIPYFPIRTRNIVAELANSMFREFITSLESWSNMFDEIESKSWVNREIMFIVHLEVLVWESFFEGEL